MRQRGAVAEVKYWWSDGPSAAAGAAAVFVLCAGGGLEQGEYGIRDAEAEADV